MRFRWGASPRPGKSPYREAMRVVILLLALTVAPAATAQAGWPAAPSLSRGDYLCSRNQAPAAWRFRVLNPNTYEKTLGGDRASGRGLYRLSPADGRILFQTGPLAGVDGRQLAAGEVGLNLDGSPNFSTRCVIP